ncbi:hypothetical protein AC579_10180 [Pseudocercospora musae]|uniref:MYND-type domain-containing protein n=1 Tax=Pseudocercospora musae TaxID=113226 RepID=A0A139HZM8_9PEZI|nr:hypothetical protein AC579_10180 [Pseudocercospora musae]
MSNSETGRDQDLIDAVAWRPGEPDEDGNVIESGTRIVITRRMFNEPGWMLSRASEMLGFPLQLRCARTPDRSLSIQESIRRQNSLACYLTLYLDTPDPTKLGRASAGGGDMHDEVVLVRQDGGPLQLQHIDVLCAFATSHTDIMHYQLRYFPDKAAEAQRVWAQYTPQAFARCLENERRDPHEDIGSLEGIESPILQFCGRCCEERQDDGSPLLVCAVCRRRRYCSKECQRNDYRRHKWFCRKPSGKRVVPKRSDS